MSLLFKLVPDIPVEPSNKLNVTVLKKLFTRICGYLRFQNLIHNSENVPEQKTKGKKVLNSRRKTPSVRPSKRKPELRTRKPVAKENVRKQPLKQIVKRKTAQPMPPLMDLPTEEGKMRFQDFDLAKEIIAATQQLGFKFCSPIQAKCLPDALAGRDLTAKAQTGTGKTAAFLASSMTRLLRNPCPDQRPRTCRVLVLEPTRELALQIEKDAEALGRYTNLYCKAIFGGMDYKEQKDSLEIPVDILACTPGRLLDYMSSNAVDVSQTEVLVIDEADRMLDMGFIPDVRRIVNHLPPPGKRQTMLFSATLEPEILRLVDRWLVDPVSVEVEPEHVVTDLIDQEFYAVMEEQKLPFLVWLIKHEPVERMIVFGNWKHKNQRLAEDLAACGIDCEQLSGDIAQNKRIRILDRFKSGECKVVVATDVAARGIHVDGISHVVNYDIPDQAEDYVHRIGRTGRAGHRGKAISFVCEFGAYNMPAIEKYVGFTAKTVLPEEECLVEPERVRPVRHKQEHRSQRSGGRRPAGGSRRH